MINSSRTLCHWYGTLPFRKGAVRGVRNYLICVVRGVISSVKKMLRLRIWIRSVAGGIRVFVERLSGKNTDDHMIALSFAIGTFIAIFPFFGLSVLAAVLFSIFFPQFHRFSLFASIAFWNPLMMIPVYLLAYVIGDYLFGTAPIVEYEVTLIYYAFHMTRRLFVGSIVLGVFFSLLSYVVVRLLLRIYKDHR